MMAEPRFGVMEGERGKHSIYKECERAHSQGSRRIRSQEGTPAAGSALSRQEKMVSRG